MDPKDEEMIKQFAQAGNMDFKNRVKLALKLAYKMNPVLFIKVCSIIFAVIIIALIIIGIIVELENPENNYNNSNMLTIGKDYVVNTAISEPNIIITDADILREAINSLNFNEEEKNNIINCISSYLQMQEKYKVNAVFAMAVAHCESQTGTNWGYIDSSTNNMFSIQGPGYTDVNGTEWRTYNSLMDSITSENRGFGDYIANHSSLYFTAQEYTVSAISSHYCADNENTPERNEQEEWRQRVISTMTNIFEACGVDTSKYNITITGKAIVDKSAELYMMMYNEQYGYNQKYHSSTPPVESKDYCEDSYSEQHGTEKKGRHTKLTDCSGYVNWVLYELGIGKFTFSTAEWINFDPSAYRIRRYLYSI